ncbi:vacuolar protein sorting-associated protein 51 homolog [Physcomitrium patens]|uniref:Vacuolar protein sorting-associated protein 51 homolog n=1 Tax=Physcomitrium patens TaxID=3218 RepID=A9STV3_PHYPA|nr:vacuolar protein sorting-associated protein 51 homolog [Physcomitrium patens]XP_024390056.1 vacuolar protein sorting-associated protein 51 homolog [Physcomitrium patens]XP_024390058.1 vacuolar protein sorting-associated protein 51 homolog [Physcomitrium patens]PNR44281.1 hypothetical protein PHYPA_016665 [Physcomitrium patens]|eukprot:XP_024390055.1 vacuolar protein sorting-associated protein 51 homolog [Physcomitrella patens]
MATKEQDEKSKRLRELLSSFYGSGSPESESRLGRRDTLQGINLPNFDSDHYISSLLRKSPLDRLLQRHVEMAAEIKNLDSDMQMLVYENYNKFISATDTIRRMKENVSGMESNMDQLLNTVTVIRGKSDGVNASLCERRERIEELNGTRSLLRKVQFIFDLPQRLRKCMSAENYAAAVKYYQGALPILKAYGQTSFRTCKEESDAIISNLIKRLQAQVMDSSAPLSARAQAVSLLQQLNYPVDTMMDTFLSFHGEDEVTVKLDLNKRLASQQGLKALDTFGSRKDLLNEEEKDFIQEFLEKAVTFRELFPKGEKRLLQACHEFFDDYFETVQLTLQPPSGNMSAAELNASFRQLSMDVSRMNELVPEANLPARASEAVESAVRKHVKDQFQNLYSRMKASLTVADTSKTPDSKESPKTLQYFLDIAQKTISNSSLEVLQDLKELLDDRKLYLLRWADEYTDLVQGGFQELFTNLVDHFLFLCVRSVETPSSSDKSQSLQTVTPSLIILASLLSVYLYQTAVPQITETLGTWFPGGGAMGSDGRPAFVPSEICRFFHTTGERLLQQYVDIQARKLSLIVRKAVDTPNWLKYKEPRDVRMFADLLLQEVERIQIEVKQLLPPGPRRTHRHSDSSGSIGSTRSASIREDGHRVASSRSNARSQLLERDVARLFTEKVEIFTKLEYNQPWVISTVVKMTLKTFEECVRLQTFNRGGYQQIQLDCHYLREPLQNLVENGTVVEILLDEVCSAASERCQDPVPLETAILDRLVQQKKAKMESAKEWPPTLPGP